jgi:hypothetical protein
LSLSQDLLKAFDRYLLPVSQTKVTTFLCESCFWHHFIAPLIKVPVEDPAKIPSSLSNF